MQKVWKKAENVDDWNAENLYWSSACGWTDDAFTAQTRIICDQLPNAEISKKWPALITERQILIHIRPNSSSSILVWFTVSFD